MNPLRKRRLSSQHSATCALAIVLLLVLAEVASACPGCKEALGSEGQGNLVQGFFWSILFMMAMPFTFLGLFGTYMYVLVRRSRAERAAKVQGPLAAPPASRSQPAIIGPVASAKA